MESIAILIPMCSRNQNWKNLNECHFLTTFYPSFLATKTEGYTYTIYLGIDDDDFFFLAQEPELLMMGFKVIKLTGCQHAPAFAWNQLFVHADRFDHDYYWQVGDDVMIESNRWTERFIAKLKDHNNLGVVGPCNPLNFNQRKNAGQPAVIENSFVHATHFALFRTFFHPKIRNWYCDDWITRIYSGICSHTFEDIIVRNRCVDNRYDIAVVPELPTYLAEGRAVIRGALRGCFSFCLFGPPSPKYYTGLQKNVELIKQYYPTWDIHVYAAPEAEDFVRCLPAPVRCIPTGKCGFVNVLHRFQSIRDKTYDVVCVRDTDSRIHARDRWCIGAFLDSPARVYTIRDHPWHHYRLMGGLWGSKLGGAEFDIEEFDRFCAEKPMQYTADTSFLDTHLVTGSRVVYSYTPGGLYNDPSENVKLIEYPMENGEFCGNVVLFNESGVEYHEFQQPT